MSFNSVNHTSNRPCSLISLTCFYRIGGEGEGEVIRGRILIRESNVNLFFVPREKGQVLSITVFCTYKRISSPIN